MKKKTFGRLVSYISASKLLLVLLMFLTILANTALLLTPKLIGEAVEMIFNDGEASDAAGIITTIFALFVLGSALTYACSRIAYHIAASTIKKLRIDMFSKIHALPISYFDTNSHGAVMNFFSNDAESISEGITHGILQLASGVISIIISLIMMFMMSPAVTIVVAFTAPICFFVSRAITKYGHGKFASQAEKISELNGYTEEMLSGRDTIKLYSYEDESKKNFGKINSELYEVGYRAQFASALVNPSTRLVNNLAYVAVGIFSILSGLSSGQITSFLLYTNQISKPFNEITSIALQLQSAFASARRIFKFLDSEEMSEDICKERLVSPSGDIAFCNVDFSYDKKRKLIKSLSLDIKKGMNVAIVGPTGAGKTTVINLLMRFYDADMGAILYDGKSIYEMPRTELRRNTGMVLQETWIFSGTIRENIAFSKPSATDKEIEDAAKSAYADSFISRLENGYNTYVTEDGGNLSEGQKQLLTIARVFLSDAAVLILDEATSNVDILTEQRIQRAFRLLMKEKTTFIIAHRLSTIVDCDVIMYMENGNVIETGSHKELLEKQGAYYNLYHSQFEKI